MTQLAPRSFEADDIVRNTWHAKPEFETPMDAMLDPAYWAHVSAKLRRGDIINALPDDNSYFAQFLVVDVGKLYAKVVKTPMCFEIKPAQMLNVEVPKGYEVKFRGPRKWSVLRGTDVLKEDMEKSDAERWLSDHVKAMAA